MTDLTKAIRDAMKRGELTHLSVKPRMSARTPLWSASYRGASERTYATHEAADPVDALLGALTSAPKKRGRKKEAPDDEDFG